MSEPDYKALVREALGQINTLKGQLRRNEEERHGPIAIVGYGCRLPGGVQDEAGLWQLLHQDQDAITASANVRFNLDSIYDPQQRRPGKTYARALGLLSGYEQIDAGFFGLADQEAERLDPQQRLLLETSWEALERGGLVPEQLAGTATGVYVGISTQEYAQVSSLQRYPEEFSAHDGPGNSLAVAAGRLSYFYGFNGPALAIDTACSSVLVCVHEAMQALRSGKVDTALAGGVNLIINPMMMVVFAQAGVLSGRGQQRCFDADGDGYVRSEACTMVVLKRLQDALDEGLPVLAVLNGGAVNHGGRSQGITTPSETGQQAVMLDALDDAGLTPADVDCVEAHATGTQLGDFIELSALQEVYGGKRDRPLWLTSVKARVGHAETGSAGPALLSALLQLKARRVAGQLHFKSPNPLFDWSQSPLQVAAAPMAWPGAGVMGISAFGYNGTNAHLILSAAAPTQEPLPQDLPLHGLKLSARSREGLQALALAWQQRLQNADPAQLPALLAMANGGRSDFDWRAWVTAGGADADRLATLVAGCAALAAGQGLPAQPVRSGKTWPRQSQPLTPDAEQQLAQAWCKGASLQWRDYYPVLEAVEIPTYPFQRRRFWPDLSNSFVQRQALQRMSQIQLFLGQHFPEPGATRYHGYLADDQLTLAAGYRVHGHNGVPPLWPLAALCSALPSGQQRLASLVWGEWPRLPRDRHLRLHSELAADLLELKWRDDSLDGHWHLAFRACPDADAALREPAPAWPEPQGSVQDLALPAPLERGELFQRLRNFQQGEGQLTAQVDASLAPNPLGCWVNQQEGENARLWLGFLGVLQAGFDLCQLWAGDGQVLFPGSCDQLDVDSAALLDCLHRQQPVTSRFLLADDAGGGVLAHWQLTDSDGNRLLQADNLVLYRVDASRLGGRAEQSWQPRTPPKVDLTLYSQALNTLQGLAPDVQVAQLLELLQRQLGELTGTAVSPDASLLALGIDSLWAMDFRARMQSELGFQLPLGFLLQGPTLQQLAQHLAPQIDGRLQGQTDAADMQVATAATDDMELML